MGQCFVRNGSFTSNKTGESNITTYKSGVKCYKKVILLYL